MNKSKVRSHPKHLSRDHIEYRVNNMLSYIFPNQGDDACPPNLEKIVEVLSTKYGVTFSFSQELCMSAVGELILGSFASNPPTIRVSSTLPMWSPLFNHTLAHEIGHLVLHRELVGKGKYISIEKSLADTKSQLMYRGAAERSDLGWVEWQANEFAISLILPKFYLQSLVNKSQKKLRIYRNFGTIYLDDQNINSLNCRRIVKNISEISGASIPFIWSRLRHLGILQDHRSNNVWKDEGTCVYEPILEVIHTLT